MYARLHRKTLFALYQTSLLVGILVLPLAVHLRRFGISLPIHRLIVALGRAYDDAS
ncbi:hypothetical protein [Natronorarus salvus]|uniref:hypothetical protein n=1 Tax=Natronorarus salvus TaxID=3117733 RepID=UPI002F26403C